MMLQGTKKSSFGMAESEGERTILEQLNGQYPQGIQMRQPSMITPTPNGAKAPAVSPARYTLPPDHGMAWLLLIIQV